MWQVRPYTMYHIAVIILTCVFGEIEQAGRQEVDSRLGEKLVRTTPTVITPLFQGFYHGGCRFDGIGQCL